MSNLVAVLFDDQSSAFALRAALVKMQTEYLLELDDAVVVTKDERGKAKLHQALNLTAVGAFGGGCWGALIGSLLLSPVIGAVVGAGVGVLGSKLSDNGISDDFMRRVGDGIKPGCSALFVLVRRATLDKVLAGLNTFTGKGTILTSSLSHELDQKLRQALGAS